jgi:hypothetical protein
LFTDLLPYQERQREDRRAALDQMTEDASEADLYAGIPEDYAMALKSQVAEPQEILRRGRSPALRLAFA